MRCVAEWEACMWLHKLATVSEEVELEATNWQAILG